MSKRPLSYACPNCGSSEKTHALRCMHNLLQRLLAWLVPLPKGLGTMDLDVPPYIFKCGDCGHQFRLTTYGHFQGVCRQCGYLLRGNITGRCPECGSTLTPEDKHET